MTIYALIERAAQRGRNSLFPLRLEISVSPVSVPQNWLSGNLPTPLHSDEKLAIPKFRTLLSNKKRFVTLELGASNKRKLASVLTLVFVVFYRLREMGQSAPPFSVVVRL